MQLDYAKAQQILKNSTVLYTQEQLSNALDKMALDIDAEIGEEIPVFLTVMNGGMMFASELTKRLTRPIIMDYIHASRYGDAQYGSSHITWYRQPKESTIKDKIVYILDDILDEGHTIAEIRRFIINSGAKECRVAVMINKEIGKDKPIYADHAGLTAPNQYLYGFGMDIFDINRNLQGIYIYNNSN